MRARPVESARPLLAKSPPESGPVPGAATLRGHTALVLAAAGELLEHRAAASLRAAGLAPGLEGRLRTLVLTGAAVHDLGKCSDHFQGMVRRERQAPQLLRHEALSLWMGWPGQPLAAWLGAGLEGEDDLRLALVAAAGHHRKFWSKALAPDGSGAGSTLDLLLHHEDFHATLKVIADVLHLGPPPSFPTPCRLTVSRRSSPEDQLRAWHEDFERRIARGSVEARLLPVVKALVLAADVAGSALPRAGEKGGWIGAQLSRRATGAGLVSVVSRRLEGRPLRPFQEAIAHSAAPLTLARAGCGSGKTVAAYAWAARQHPGRQVWLTYPTTGTATEGFRDYLPGTEVSGRLEHSRAEVDLDLLDLREDGAPLRGEDRLDALRAWGMDVLTCTVDTVLGLVQNQRKGLYAWPALCDACVVFDEVHAYDARLFGALLCFLEALPGIPVLLMTASLPEARLQALRALGQRVHGVPLAEIEGPADLEGLARYQRVFAEAEWSAVDACLARGGKVLWVSNTVERCLRVSEEAEQRGLPVRRYHSRFRYADRVLRHGEVIDAFQQAGPVLACTTQVAEMSLDLSADLLVTDRAPIPALIQRLGRLNRRATPASPSSPAPFLVLPFAGQPYDEKLLREADVWLERLGTGPLSQRALVDAWTPRPEAEDSRPLPSAWLEGGFTTEPAALREASPSLTVLRAEDADAVRRGQAKSQAMALPMNSPPQGLSWAVWPRVDFLPVAPLEALDYDPLRGARWRKP
ncbi:CRISPR-associated helicase Cas3' [Melittangium boletus]|uniref:CRISPR-associated helicase Cas3' n=1 Tax=Melittangium boletus TaxID=83453 RepID=UPI003DA502E0